MTTMAGLNSFSKLQYCSTRDVAMAILVVLLGFPLVYMVHRLLVNWQRCRRTRRIFEAQGVKVLPRSNFLLGNLIEIGAMYTEAWSKPLPDVSHDIVPRVMPDVFHWSKIHGKRFVSWFAFQARYVLEEPEQGRELFTTKSGHFRKPTPRPDTKDFVGEGLATVDGEKWANHRRVLNQAFFLEKLKAMAPTMVALTNNMMKKWEPHVEGKEAIDVADEFRKLTADIIAYTAFGSSFAEGKAVFQMQYKQQALYGKLHPALYIPGSRFLPTPRNWYLNRLKRGVHEGLARIIKRRMQLKERSKGDVYGNDLLGLMLAANKGELHGNQRNVSMGLEELIDECKTFFFAGHETTATLLTYTCLLLAIHPEWQERLREEVFEACGKDQLPTAESLNYFKLMAMVINEALRLYPSAAMTAREAAVDMKLGEILVPAGTFIVVPIVVWHHDEQYWGADVNEFRPERFEGGVAKACKIPGAYLPFGIGPRHCIGQQFGLIEAKMVLATILQRYRFRLSPKYEHAPTIVVMLRSETAMPLIFEKLW